MLYDNSQSIFSMLFVLMFLLVAGLIIYRVVQGIGQYRKNEASPRLTVNARVVAKRADVSHNHHTNNGAATYTSDTTYYVTFEVDSGDRMELRVNGQEYGQLAEGDVGLLSFQGTRYQGFERR